jgi:hypothetical protein
MECPLWRLLISSGLVSKHGHHMQFVADRDYKWKLWKVKFISYWKYKLEAQPTEPVSLTFHSALWNLNTESSIHVHASYQVSAHMAKQFQRRRFFRNWPIRNKNCMWWPCLLTNLFTVLSEIFLILDRN